MAEAALKVVVAEEITDGASACKAMGQIFERVGDKWTIMIVSVLSHGPTRFNTIQRLIPTLSHKMLTVTLRGLERDGLVKRTAFPTIPPRVEYELTPQGRSLIKPLEAVGAWAREHRDYIEAARKAFDDALALR